MKTFYLLLLLFTSHCLAEPQRIDVLSGFDIYLMPVQLSVAKAAGFTIHNVLPPFDYEKIVYDEPSVKKIILINYADEYLLRLPKEKLVYFLMEPGKWPLEFYDSFSRVYTWDDELVDGVKFFKLYYPYLMPMKANLLPFAEKKLCVMVSGSDGVLERENELYSERMKMVEFFETKPEGEFDIYGWFWQRRFYRDYRGHIPGNHSGPEKINTLAKYRFCICFENTKNTYGYISEKIFNCFAAGCVPVYWGATNIDTYIPKSCFIDFRDFSSREDLYQFIKTMPEEVYTHYLENIRLFIESPEGRFFTPDYFEEMFYEAITQ